MEGFSRFSSMTAPISSLLDFALDCISSSTPSSDHFPFIHCTSYCFYRRCVANYLSLHSFFPNDYFYCTFDFCVNFLTEFCLTLANLCPYSPLQVSSSCFDLEAIFLPHIHFHNLISVISKLNSENFYLSE